MKLPFKADLSDKTVAVTGGGGVLMSEFAVSLAECGARVAVLDINYESARSVADRIGERAFAVECDCLDKSSVILARERIREKWGKVNLLINGAGGNAKAATCDNEYMQRELDADTKSFFDLDTDGLRFVFDLNIMSAFIVTQVFAEDMVNDGGNIINISSMNAYRPLTKIPAYSAAKAGISNFTQWLSVHFAPCNIRVNAIAPGFFVTNQNRDLLFDADGNPTPRTDKILNATPFGRFGRPEELIGTLLYLACDEASSFVTGTVIAVDGGFVFHSMIPAVFALCLGSIAGYARFTRAELSEVLTGEFMLLARTKGLTKRQAIYRHAMRNSMVVIFPSILSEFISVLSGSLIIERMFGINGVGGLYLNSITFQDYDFFMLLSGFYTLVSLTAGIVIDISYGFIDPRIRMGAK